MNPRIAIEQTSSCSMFAYCNSCSEVWPHQRRDGLKIGVVADTHLHSSNEVELLKKIIHPHFDVDLILHAGDLVVLDALKPLEEIAKVVAVSGNMDYAEVVSSLPEKTVVKAGKFRIGLTHGSGPPQGLTERIKGEFNKVDCIVFGHTHQPLNQMRDGVLFFNPGSPLDKTFTSTNSLGILEINDKIEGRIIQT